MSSSSKIRTHFSMNINDNVSIFQSMIKLDGSLLFNDRNEMNWNSLFYTTNELDNQ